MTSQFAQCKGECCCIRFDRNRWLMMLSWNMRKVKRERGFVVGFLRIQFWQTCKCVFVCVLQCYHTDVSQSAPPRAAACPSLGFLPTQEVSVLTHCVLVALRGGIHPITLQQGRVRRMIFPVGMGRVNFIVTTASTELMFHSFLQLLARTCPHSNV